MRKLKLEIEALEVESFDTDGRALRAAGTVHGRSGSIGGGDTCDGCPPWIDRTIGCPLPTAVSDCPCGTGPRGCGETEIGQLVCGTGPLDCP